ncbi:HD family hydrolase [Pantoea coffeiphila]|uniref:HD family hydrolase n=1 Tax=Pantoea coffeiphila TaxID=1465635 RepID=UPI0019607CDE|nr:HD family hydrolase [Pantoea coffeiphila]MBM7346188.1 5'-deoxynucleotidase YfbR-like HD superfamily hydrolase [Pantoea coffeiphila]
MTWINTLSGKHFSFTDIDAETITIEDIAGALSNLCRFTGHVQDFYSVAQHSVYVSRLVPPEMALEALLHDAAEAYCGDVSSPLKAFLPDYQVIEHRVDQFIRGKFDLPVTMSTQVKRADLIMLATERRDFDMDDGTPWPVLEGIECADFMIYPLTPRQARVQFLQRYNELKGGI